MLVGRVTVVGAMVARVFEGDGPAARVRDVRATASVESLAWSAVVREVESVHASVHDVADEGVSS